MMPYLNDETHQIEGLLSDLESTATQEIIDDIRYHLRNIVDEFEVGLEKEFDRGYQNGYDEGFNDGEKDG